jgi:DNA topoisomerase-3
MRNAWRFVDDEVLRERLKEAKGIGTPATRAEIIGGLKKQGFLIAQGKNIVPTETGMSLFGVLKHADPALVDPGVTAQLECLLDEVVIGKQEMVGAIDAVCDVAQRIIGKLKDGASEGPPLLRAAVGGDAAGRPPTPAMKRFANSIARQKRIKPPPGYTKSGSICRAFLDQHAPQKAEVVTSGELGAKPASPAQMLFAEKIARERGIVIPDETKASSAAVSAWIASNLSTERGKGRRKTADNKPPRSTAPKSIAPKKRLRKRTADAAGGPATPARQNAETGRVARRSDWGIRD